MHCVSLKTGFVPIANRREAAILIVLLRYPWEPLNNYHSLITYTDLYHIRARLVILLTQIVLVL